jgi:quinol monooxygenase YgiN
MNTQQLIILAGSLLASSLFVPAAAEEAQTPYVRVAEIEIDPSQLETYKAVVWEEIEASIREEPGVLAIHAVSVKDNPSRVITLEVYASEDAYKAHIASPHFKKYKTLTQDMVKSLKLHDTLPIMLGAKK